LPQTETDGRHGDPEKRFIDMVFVPQQMRALIGNDHEHAAAPRRIDAVLSSGA
jgi:hypothetical protein